MPVVIKTGTMKYKSPTAGRYVEINMLSDNATQEQIAAIRAAGADETAGVRTAAETALAAAETANTAAAGADTAASNANTKATLADEKASLADTAATNANTKAALADEKATLANTKAALADEKATLANTKAALADEKATLANTKANLADEKATAANTAAGAANTAAGAANAAATKIDDMTVAASGLAEGASPTVQISEVSGHKHIAFGIPKGDTGATPDISIGTVTTLSPGSSATASMTGTAEEPVLNLGIPAGYDASITSQTDYFQNSTSGTVIPTGTWETTQPTTPQGSFLWIKHHIVWNDNNTTDVYSVSRMGIDGLGSVSSLAIGNLSLSPDASGKITVPLDSTPTESSDNLVNSGSVATQIAGLSARIDALDPESSSGIFTDVTFSITANQWTLANGIYSFTYNNVLLTSTSGIEVFYDSSLRSAIVGDIFVAKNTGNVVFSTTKAPIGTLTGALRIIDSVTGTIPVYHGGTGAVTAKGARQNLNVSIRPIPVNFGTVTSLPQTRYDADITSDMIPSKWVFGNPAACPNGIKCTTADGSVTLSVPTGATFSGETTISIELVNPRAVVDGGSGQATEQSTADYVQIGAQTLTVQEQAQVRENIDVPSSDDLGNLSSLTTTAQTSVVDAINEVNGKIPSTINGLFSHNSSSSITPTRNGDTTVWTAPSDCIAFINVLGTCDAGGGYMRVMLKKNNVVLSEGYTIPASITTGAYPSNITLCSIAQMKAGDVFKVTTGFSNNANPKTFFWNVMY